LVLGWGGGWWGLGGAKTSSSSLRAESDVEQWEDFMS
jgi:hypothetical protein